jgi:uncharacterized membrane protein
MTQLAQHAETSQEDRGSHRYGRDSLEFGRVANLSDAVFAIALTLLVLNIDAPGVPTDELAGALAAQTPQIAMFALSFFLVASAWWHHHRIFARLGWIEPGLIAINLGLLAAVALVPFPTSVLGSAPGSRAAVIPFIALFMLLSLLFVTLMMRAQLLGAWDKPLPMSLFRWVLADWVSILGVYGACLLLAFWAPVVALVFLAVGSPLVGMTAARLAPRARRAWF